MVSIADFLELDTEFDVCSLLKFEVHRNIANAHVHLVAKYKNVCNTGLNVTSHTDS